MLACEHPGLSHWPAFKYSSSTKQHWKRPALELPLCCTLLLQGRRQLQLQGPCACVPCSSLASCALSSCRTLCCPFCLLLVHPAYHSALEARLVGKACLGSQSGLQSLSPAKLSSVLTSNSQLL